MKKAIINGIGLAVMAASLGVAAAPSTVAVATPQPHSQWMLVIGLALVAARPARRRTN